MKSFVQLSLVLLIALLAIGPGASAAVFSDDFQTETTGAMPSKWTGTSTPGFQVRDESGSKMLYNTGTDAHVWPTDSNSTPANWANFDMTVRLRGLDQIDLRISGSNFLRIQSTAGGVTLYEMPGWTSKGTRAALTAGTWYRMRLNCDGSAVKIRFWADGGTEPSTWDINTTTTKTAGGRMDFNWHGAISIDDMVVNAIGGGDTTAPSAVSNLSAPSSTSNSVTLNWTAPGDDGSTGTATTYDIRRSTATITDANWASATAVTGEPAPQVAGTAQSMTVSGLSASTTYYFAMKTADEVPNTSALSNVISRATTAGSDSTAPAAVSNLTAPSSTSSSVTLNWTAPGDDGSTGTATTYDIRRSTATITDANWASATAVTGEPTPAAAGTGQSMTVSGLNASTTYYFAMKTADEVPNTSGLSNVVSRATTATGSPTEWSQHGHDAQHTGYTDQTVATPWRWKWSWNGPNATGGVSAGKTSLLRNVQPVTGGGRVYVARGSGGVYALNDSDGSVAWNRSPGGNINATVAYDAGSVYAPSSNGYLYRLDPANGNTLYSFNAGSAISTPPCVLADRVLVSAGNYVYALNKTTLAQLWRYDAGSATQTPPVYSPSRNRVIVCTSDLYVHAINNTDASRAWRIKPTTRSAGSPYEFVYGWPVIAEGHGYVLVKMRSDWDTMWTWNPWPTDNATIRSNLQGQPNQQVLFAMSLDNGSIPFICNLGNGGWGDGGYMPMGPQPVVKKFADNSEVVYTIIRGKQGVDGRWDSMYGEMVLDSTTISGLQAGYVRWINYNSMATVLTDEQPFVSMSGNNLLGGHWMAGLAMQITDRSSSRGSYASPITTSNLPHFVASTNAVPFSATHWDGDGLTQDGDPRNFPAGFYIYYNQGTIYDQYFEGYSGWVVSNNIVYYRSSDGAIIALENGDPTSGGQGLMSMEMASVEAPAAGQTEAAKNGASDKKPAVISYLDAADYAGQVATVEGTIRYIFNNGKTVLLGFENPHFGYFKVQIPKDSWGNFPSLGAEMGRDGAKLYAEGQTIRVTGTIQWYQGDPAIYARQPSQIGGDAADASAKAKDDSADPARVAAKDDSVEPAKDAAGPTVKDLSVTTAPNQAVSGQVVGVGKNLVFSVVDQPQHGAVTLASDGSFVYTPQAGYEGEDSFTVLALAEGQSSKPATVTVTIQVAQE